MCIIIEFLVFNVASHSPQEFVTEIPTPCYVMNFATHKLSVGTQHSTIQFATNVTAYVTNMPCQIKLFGWAVTFYYYPVGACRIL